MNTLNIALTDLEKQVIEGINNSDYGDQLGDPIWAGTECCEIADTRAIRGVMSSLSQKGIVLCVRNGNDSTVQLTPLGIELCKQYNLLGKFVNN